jgi:hypothetical protein
MDQSSSKIPRFADIYYDTISKEASRLFEIHKIDIEVLHTRPRTSSSDTEEKVRAELEYTSGTHTSRVRTLDQLNNHLEPKTNAEGTVVYLIPQRFSWGRLQITPEAFDRIRLEKRISAGIIHILREFGSKTCDKLPQNCSFQADRSDKQTHTYGTTHILYSNCGTNLERTLLRQPFH